MPEKPHHPVPKTNKEVKEMLGLTGYYWKFIPAYGDLVWPLMHLHIKSPFIWKDQHQKAFNMLKDTVMKSTFLVYPDQSKPYTFLQMLQNMLGLLY